MQYNTIKKLVDLGLSQYQISDKLNIGQTTVRYWLNKYELKTNTKLKAGKKCQFCNCDLNRRQKKFCSVRCQKNLAWDLRKKEIFLKQEENSVECAKRFLLEVRGTQCEICKNVEWCGKPIPLVMDHIDGHHENNSLDNLRLVCGNCDMQLPTYKNKNKGNGRHSRKKRYQDGKSF